MEQELMTVTEAAESLGISGDLIRQRIRRGAMQAERVGPIFVITRDEVERWRGRGLLSAGRKPKPRRRPGRPRKEVSDPRDS